MLIRFFIIPSPLIRRASYGRCRVSHNTMQRSKRVTYATSEILSLHQIRHLKNPGYHFFSFFFPRAYGGDVSTEHVSNFKQKKIQPMDKRYFVQCTVL
jgi:hypothetical protein